MGGAIAAGAAYGAAVGSAAGPIGTIGGAVVGILGGLLGAFVGKKIAQQFPTETKMEVVVGVNSDEVIARTARTMATLAAGATAESIQAVDRSLFLPLKEEVGVLRAMVKSWRA